MTFVSYAQNFEDVMLWRALRHLGKGFYIDVGANDPDTESVTRAFYERGWRGINIEPIPQWFEKLVKKRPGDINLALAAGNHSGEIEIFEIPDTGLSTFDENIANRHEVERGYLKKIRIVKAVTLTEICATYNVDQVHFLKIDVEGAEKQVLEGLNLSMIRPWIILVESTLPNTQIQNHEEWEHFLLRSDYKYVFFDGLNRYYLSSEHKELKLSFDAPPNVFDDFIRVQQLEWQNRALKAEVENAQLEKREEQAVIEAHQVKERAERAETKAQQAEEKAERAETKAQQAEEKAIRSEAKAQRAEEQAERSEAKAQQAEEKVSRAKAKAAQLEVQAQQAEEKARQLQAQLNAVYSSYSWRISWPLRKLAELLFFSFRLPQKIFKGILIIPMKFVLARPALGKRIDFVVSRFPKVRQKLLKTAEKAELVVPPGHDFQSESYASYKNLNNPDMACMSPTARHIYVDLKKAIKQKHGIKTNAHSN